MLWLSFAVITTFTFYFESVSRKSSDSTFRIVIVQRNFSIIDQELHYDLLDGKLLYLCSSGSYKKISW